VRMIFGMALFAALVLPFTGLPNGAADRMIASEPVPSPYPLPFQGGEGRVRGPAGLPRIASTGLDDCLPKDPPPPVVKIKVRVAACADPGQLIEYRICVENCSIAEAHHVVVKNAVPNNAKFVKADPEPAKQGPELQWNLGTIGGGAVREIILILQPTNKEDVKNCARVQFEHGQCVVTRLAARLPGERPPIISTVPDAVRPEDLPVLDLVVRGPKEQRVNMPAKYEITLTNKGKTKAMNTQVGVRVPNQLKVLKASEPGVAVENVIVWNLGHVEPAASKLLEMTLRATDKGEFCFRVTARADLSVEKEVEFCTKFTGASAMAVEMVGRNGVVFVGDKTSYPITIFSQGSEPLTNIDVRALIPNALKLERANAAFDELEQVKEGKWIKFKNLPKIEGGAQARYEIFVEALKAGVTTFQIQVRADQLDPKIGPVTEQEITNIVDDRDKPKVKEMSRTKDQQNSSPEPGRRVTLPPE
jgi:uncharacterized repeat protein (TIGR01451 family)